MIRINIPSFYYNKKPPDRNPGVASGYPLGMISTINVIHKSEYVKPWIKSFKIPKNQSFFAKLLYHISILFKTTSEFSEFTMNKGQFPFSKILELVNSLELLYLRWILKFTVGCVDKIFELFKSEVNSLPPTRCLPITRQESILV